MNQDHRRLAAGGVALALAVLLAALSLFRANESTTLPGVQSQLSNNSSNELEIPPPSDDPNEASPSFGEKATKLIDQSLTDRYPQYPDLEESMAGWQRDAIYEIELIRNETFAETLSNTASKVPNYLFLIMCEITADTMQENAYLKRIALSRRYGKLIEELSGPERPQHLAELIAQLEADAAKFRKMRETDASGDPWFAFSGPTYAPSIEDQSDLPKPLANRIYLQEMLVGHFGMQEALPAVLGAVDAMEGTFVMNWSAVMYACDKALTAEFGGIGTNDAQRRIRKEYLDWRQSICSQDARKAWHFEYVREEIPSYRSTLRPYERSTSMGAPIDTGAGMIVVEFPPPLLQQGIHGGALFPEGPQKEVVEFARRFVAAGQQY